MLQNVHICCLVLGLLLLATSVTHVHGAEKAIYAMGGLEHITSTSLGSECTLTLPDKTVCHYNYGSATTPSPSEICITQDFTYPYCYFQVNITSKTLSGVYTLEYKMENGTPTEDTIYVYLLSGGVPTDEIQVVENENIYLRLRDSFETSDGRKCEAFGPNGIYESLWDSSGKSPNHWGKEDECGFKVEGVSIIDTGKWTLQMSSSGAAYLYAEFEVEVISLDEINPGPNPLLIWRFGEQGTLSMTTQHTKYCEIWNPKKELVQRACSYTQNIVTDADEGNWTFVFGIDGKLAEETLVLQIIVIKIEENN